MISELQKKELRRKLAGLLIEDVSLDSKTAFKVGGCAAFYLQPESLKELGLALQTLADLELQFIVLGGGWNTLINDNGIDNQVVINPGKGFTGLNIIGSDKWSALLRAECGVQLSQLIKLSAAEGYCGVEKLAGIPGTIGGAVAMNAGAYGTEIFDSLAALQIMEKENLTCNLTWVRRSQLKPAYRDGGLNPEQVVVAAYFLLQKKAPADIHKSIEEVRKSRKLRLPPGAHAGSVFKNPANDYAGRLLDESGCKGMRCGGAFVSELNANVIVADPDAQAADIISLIDNMRLRVNKLYGINLETEIKIFSGGNDEI